MVRHRLSKAVVTVFAVAVTIRLAPLLWTPYPFNPDGFAFAAQARDTVAAGTLAHDLIGPHGYILPTVLSLTAVITDVAPLWLAQPVIALIGALPPVIAVVFVWRLGTLQGGRSADDAIVATAVGLTLALEGIYLRRTVTVSYEVLGLVFVPLVAITAARFCRTTDWRWGLATVTLLLVLPITHHLSTFMAALTLTGIVVLAGARDWRTIGAGLVVLIPFWLYVGLYYSQTRPPFSDELAAKPGLFLAWLVFLGAGVVWLARSPTRTVRTTGGSGLLCGFVILGASARWDLFPGTATTPPRLLMYVAPLGLLAGLAIWGLPLGTGPVGDRAVVLALLAAPIAWVGFALTAGVDPVYVLFARRGQTFVHLAVVVCAGLAILELGRRWAPPAKPVVTVGLPILLCCCALASLPLAFAGLEALAYQGTTTTEEFETVTFASTTLNDNWTSDDHVTRVASNYYQTGASPQPAYAWLHGGELRCPTVMQQSWQTVGAQQYPASPVAIDRSVSAETRQTNQVVYTTTGADPLTIVVPTTGRDCG